MRPGALVAVRGCLWPPARRCTVMRRSGRSWTEADAWLSPSLWSGLSPQPHSATVIPPDIPW